MSVKIYTSPTCGYCHLTKQFLSGRGVEFTEYDVSRDRAAAEEMVRLTGQMGVPVTVIDEQTVIGFDQARLEQLLEQSGEGQHPHFGLKVADATTVTQKLGATPVFGAFVGAVATSSLGEKAGIRQGDIITEVNLRRINNADELETALANLTPGSRVTIVFLRGQQTLKTEITV